MKVRQVFFELRNALGTSVPAGELLKLAAALVDATSPEQGNVDDGTSPTVARDLLPLDQAFADGGWRVMEREPRWIAEIYPDDDPKRSVTRRNRMKMEFAI
jgi:hypothetical protein